MWSPVSPTPMDFCGRPPCPLCFRWQDGDSPPILGLQKIAFDLLQKSLGDLTKRERRKLYSVARRMHKGGLASLSRPIKKPPAPDAVDIGMSSARQLEGWLRDKRRKAVPARQLTLDEIAVRTETREAAQKAKQAERNERLKEAREIAQILAEAQPKQQSDDALRGVDPSFVSYCNSRGIFDPREIMYRYQREYQSMRGSQFDPRPGYGY